MHPSRLCVSYSYACLDVGISERLFLRKKAAEAQERGEPIPDMPGMQEALNSKGNFQLKACQAGDQENLKEGNARRT